MEEKILNIQKNYLDKIRSAKGLKKLDEIFLGLFGKNGAIDSLSKEFPRLSADERHRIGPLFNKVKAELENAIGKKREEIREEEYKKLETETLTLQGNALEASVKKRKGHLHPLTQFEKEIADIFGKIGFQQYEAPHIDTDENNFQVLNIPEDHPARDLQDTLYVETGPTPQKLLLRTHTSNSQIRIMRDYKPPIRLINLGRCFRYENLDPRHEHTFDQFELVYIDQNVSMANLQYLSEYLIQKVFGKKVRVRLRPKYYPFVEPGAGVDAECIFCKGGGCRICQEGWLELAGAGMIHPQVLKNGGIDPTEYSGIAWGFSPPRTLMLKLGIEDIRLFNSGNLKFLQKY